ncbi:single-stranded DNA-binding protein [Parapedobacter soli]|uniref:single-stranded DNA-binding protein n=1 Tax=Parapedobacter soli TaxID=416955 RepID=UPI0021C75D10|nr:single-stranded DNA-binding protein [Parapedobacter soli]
MSIHVGRVTADATVKEFESGKSVVNFTIAKNRSYKAKGSDEWKEKTTYIEVAYWLGTGVASRLRKGAVVEVNGWEDVRVYENGKGEHVGVITLQADDIVVHSSGSPTTNSED